MSMTLHFLMAANACGTHTGVLPSLYDGLNCDSAGNIHLNNLQEVLRIIANVARVLIALAGGLAVIFVIVGGLWYITSAGDPGRIKQAKDILFNAAIGILLIVTAYAVVTFIASKF